jgi:recombination protein RecA
MNPLQKAMMDINKKFKSEIIQQGTETVYVDKIPFGSPRANYLSYGGIPIGKATEFFGGEGGGKTTSALDITAQAQKKAKREWQEQYDKVTSELEGLLEKHNKSDADKIKRLQTKQETLEENGWKKVLYIDAENTLDTVWAKKLGVDIDDLILMRPQAETAEQVLQILLDLVDTGQVILAVLDSVPMLVSQSLYDETLEKKSYGGIAGVMTEFCRKVTPKLTQNHTALLMINQQRENFDNPYDQHKTAGGKALKHLYALRLFFKKGSFLDENYTEQPQRFESPYGNMVDIQMVKTKVCKPDRRIGQYTLSYYSGIDYIYDTIYMAIKYNLIKQSGAWYEIVANGEKFQGKARIMDYFEENQDVFETIYEQVQQEVTREE